MSKKAKDLDHAQYIVVLDYQKPDGYWLVGHREEVEVPYDPKTENEKDLHERASNIVMEKYSNAKVFKVIYC